jgi:hypothetical protein
MKVELTAHEARIIGCLIEKQITTPEQYPLSLNALANACNQKSNRDPVLELAESEVQRLVDGLSRKHLLLERSGFGSRVPKYQQRFCNTEFSVFQFTEQERAIVCELLLRGPQTPGELRSRAARMAAFSSAEEVESALEALAARTSGPMVRRLAREAGKREARYAHLFGVAAEAAAGTAAAAPAQAPVLEVGTADGADGPLPGLLRRVGVLEQQIAALRAEIEQLRRGD